MPLLSPEKIAELQAKNSSGFAYKLPSGDVIPPNVNPGKAATVDIAVLRAQGGASPVPDYLNTLVDQQIAAGIQVDTKAPAVQDLSTSQGRSNAAGFSPSTLPAQRMPSAAEKSAIPSPMDTTNIGTAAGSAFPTIDPGTLIPPADLAAFQKANPNLKFGWSDLARYNKTSYAPATTPTSSGNAPVINGAGGLTNNAAINALGQKIDDNILKIKAGLSGTPTTDILNSLYVKFNISADNSLLDSYNQMILTKMKELAKLPDDIKNSLQDVGVSDSQLRRLVTKESLKPEQALSDLMKEKGVLQDRINQSLTFVKQFADAAMKDQAAQLEAAKWEVEQEQGQYKELKADQRKVLDLAIEDSKSKLALGNEILKAGGDPSLIAGAQDYAEAQQLAAPFFKSVAGFKQAQQEAPGIATQISGMSDKQALDFIRNRATSLGVDPNSLLSLVEEESAKLAHQAYVDSKSIDHSITAADKPLDILNVQRYNDLYPDAGVSAGDTQAQADSKVAASNSPEAQTRKLVQAAKDNNNTYDVVVSEINKDATIKDKATALKIAQEVYGVNTTSASPVYGKGNFANIDIQTRAEELAQFGNSGQIKSQLLNDGYDANAALKVANQYGSVIPQFINTISTYLFGA